MKILTLFSVFLCYVFGLQAQQTITIKGQLLGHDLEQTYYSGGGRGLAPLKLSPEGHFEVEIMSGASPTKFTINTISKRGKINSLFPILWVDEEEVTGIFDLEKRKVQTSNSTTYQLLSEKIEGASKKKRVNIIAENVNEPPSLYFLNLQKESISLDELEAMIERVESEYHDLAAFQQIGNYISAKRFGKVKMGSKITDFTLANAADEQESILSDNNKTKLIAILSSGCSFSLASISLLDQLEQINNGNLEQVTIWNDKDKDTWLKYRSDLKEKITWKNLIDEHDFAFTYLDNNSFPTFYVVSPEGILVDKFTGYSKRTEKKLRWLVER